jgi:hypothetical protein
MRETFMSIGVYTVTIIHEFRVYLTLWQEPGVDSLRPLLRSVLLCHRDIISRGPAPLV